MCNPFSLRGKTILVTGASSGIGRATAVECSKIGASLIITARNSQRLDETLHALAGDGHRAVICDLDDESQMTALVGSVDKIDGLVLCSGVGMMLPFQFSSTVKLGGIMKTNFMAPVELFRMLVKKKKFAGSSSVVAISSMGGTHFYTVGNGAYGASKAALDSLMKFAARELAGKGIRVNSILPAMIDTPLIHNGAVSEEEHKADAERYPLKRYGLPEDVAYAVIYLLSDAASWVTGSSLVIDGGRSLV